jgi:hypothetical protein
MMFDDFEERWVSFGNGALCSVEGGRLVVKLSLSAPVPVVSA